MNDKIMPWEASCIVEKAYQDSNGKMHVVAVASDDLTDLQSDCMSKSALNKMAGDATKGVPLLDNHKSTFEFGRTVKGAVVTKEVDGKAVQQFVVDLELDAEWPHAKALYKEIKSKQCIKQLSIGGKLNLKNPNAISVEMTEKGLVRKINDLELDHIACTRSQHAANPRTGFVSAIMKSLDDEKAFDGVTPIQQVVKAEAEAAPSVNIDTEETTTQSAPAAIDEAAKDIEAGAGILQTIGRLFRNKNGGKDMSKAKVTKGSTTDDSTTGSDESMDTQQKVDAMLASASPAVAAPEAAPEKADPLAPEALADADSNSSDDSSGSSDSSTSTSDSSGSTTSSSDTSSSSTGTTSGSEPEGMEGMEGLGDLGEVSPAEEEAARVLMSARAKREQIRKDNEKGESEEDIVREIAILLSKHNRSGAGTRVDKEVLRGALWNVRYLLAKNIMEKITKEVAGGTAEAGAAEAMAKLIMDGGAYAPTTESAAKGEKVAGDKQSGENDMGKNSVTDSRKQTTYAEGSEKQQKEGAPSAKESASAINAAVAVTEKLPKLDETAEYGKSDKGVDLEKSMNSMLEKSVQAAGQLILKSTEMLAKAQKDQFAALSTRLASLEKAGGVSQSAPRGTDDAVVQKSRQPKSMWGGMLGSAPAQAMSKM